MDNKEKQDLDKKEGNNQAHPIKKGGQKRSIKKKLKLFCLIIIIILSSNIFLIAFRRINKIHWYIADVDRRENGHTFVCMMEMSELLQHPFRNIEQIEFSGHEDQHKVIELDENGKVVWELTGLGFPHEVVELPNGHLLIAEAYYDRVIEVNYPNKDILWEWNVREIDWEVVNPEWDSDHYYSNPKNFMFTHLNDIEYKELDNYSVCLISIREFNLIVEVNYTAERTVSENDPNNIIWYYCDYDNSTLLNHQHNPDYLDNGNLLIADSGNNRIIELDHEEKKIVWEYRQGLSWPRDADDLGDGTILITDTQNNRILKIDKETKSILWSHILDLVLPYESDQLSNGAILVGNGHGGTVLEIQSNGAVKVLFGIDFLKILFSINAIIVIGFDILAVFNFYKRNRKILGIEPSFRKKERKKVKLAIYISIFILGLILIFAYNHLFATLIYPIFSRFW